MVLTHSHSAPYSGRSLIQTDSANSSSGTGLVFISLWCTSYLSVNTLHMLPNHFLKVILIIKKVLLPSLITRKFIFHVAFHVLGYIVSKHKFYWVSEDSKEIWKLLTAAFINNLSEHKTYRKDGTEIVSLRQFLNC